MNQFCFQENAFGNVIYDKNRAILGLNELFHNNIFGNVISKMAVTFPIRPFSNMDKL